MPVLLSLDINGFRMKAILVLIQIFDEGDDSAFVKEVMSFLGPFILDADGEAFVQKSQFPQTLRE